MYFLTKQYEKLSDQRQRHLTALEKIVKDSGALLEGNSFYVHNSLKLFPQLLPKQVNLFHLGAGVPPGGKICEIGFNAGHSAMLLLLGREEQTEQSRTFTIFDIGSHPYTKPCVQYMKDAFLHVDFDYFEGDSITTIPKWIRERPKGIIGTYNIVHVDGGHSVECITNDMRNADLLVNPAGGIIIVDDTNVDYINTTVDSYLRTGKYRELDVVPTVHYPHRVIQKNDPVAAAAATAVADEVVSSRGIATSCDITPIGLQFQPWYTFSRSQYAPRSFENYAPGSLLYLQTSALRSFVTTELPKLTIPFVLVTGDTDDEIPNSLPADIYTTLVTSPVVKGWFTQNCLLPADAVVPEGHIRPQHMPIGIHIHCLSVGLWCKDPIPPEKQHSLLRDFADKGGHFSTRLPKCYGSFRHTVRNISDRKAAMAVIPADAIDHEEDRVPTPVSWEHQIRYAFVASPFGGGPDCHRTWEALALGCIPIVRRSPLNIPLFDDLPVWQVTEWSEVTVDAMKAKIVEFSGQTFKMEKITLQYWMDRIRCG